MDMIDIMRDVLLPVATLAIGWLSSSYRNRQQKESDVLNNVQQILEMKTREVERAQSEVDRAHLINDRQEAVVRRLEAKLDRRDKAIRKSKTCEWVRNGNDCPVTIADERYIQELDTHQSPCSQCDARADAAGDAISRCND